MPQELRGQVWAQTPQPRPNKLADEKAVDENVRRMYTVPLQNKKRLEMEMEKKVLDWYPPPKTKKLTEPEMVWTRARVLVVRRAARVRPKGPAMRVLCLVMVCEVDVVRPAVQHRWRCACAFP